MLRLNNFRAGKHHANVVGHYCRVSGMTYICRSADLRICCLAGFKTRVPSAGSTRSNLQRAADLEIGDTAGSETCATLRVHPAP
jgi:hypothetical protein